ncbi:RidA family protein [Bilophila wadsworthia]|uniref:RidA family protein n=1 Tax=Bilophila wadsworthia TaxID=35833 RepID=UPI003AB7CB88
MSVSAQIRRTLSIVNAAYSEVFRNDFPARSCVAVKQLPLNGLVEMEATVVLEKQ